VPPGGGTSGRKASVRKSHIRTHHPLITAPAPAAPFASNHALWIARYNSADAGALPAGWSSWTFWQYDNGGSLPGDQNLVNGSLARLKRFARGT
jgi:lysozyme